MVNWQKVRHSIAEWLVSSVVAAVLVSMIAWVVLQKHTQENVQTEVSLTAAGAVRDNAIAACQAESLLLQARMDRICDRVRVLEKFHGIETPSGARRQMREAE